MKYFRYLYETVTTDEGVYAGELQTHHQFETHSRSPLANTVLRIALRK